MDLLCQRCGEPWDYLYIRHDEGPETWNRFRQGKGCPYCEDQPEENFKGRAEDTAFARQAQAALGDVLGDDYDGLAAMMEDFGLI